MKLIVPDYYNRFKCLMGGCRHSCCKGWEIDIDSDTLELYRSLPDETRAWLMAGIKEEDGCTSFRTDKNMRCPFLRDDGLCEIVLRLGMEALSDICFDHPVFRNWFTDRIEQGLGLCCESAAELILSNPDTVSFIVLDSDGSGEELSEGDAQLLSFRDSLIALAQDRSIPVMERLEKIESLCSCRPADIPALAGFMKNLETMDICWQDYLADAEKGIAKAELPRECELPLEQLLVYLIFRHTDSITSFALPMFRLIYSILSSRPGCSIAELCRIWSAEIEYSDENPQLICEWVSAHS